MGVSSRVVGLVVLVVILAGCRGRVQKQPPRLSAPDGAERVSPAEWEEKPEIVGEDLDGRKIKLSDYRGKVVLVDFWRND